MPLESQGVQSFLKTVTQHSPGYSADTINGPVPIDAIGTIDMWIEFTDDAGNKSWRLHSDIPNVPHVAAGHARKFDTPADDSIKFDASQCPADGSPEHE